MYVPSVAYPLCSLEQYLLVQYRATTSTCTVLYILLADGKRGVVIVINNLSNKALSQILWKRVIEIMVHSFDRSSCINPEFGKRQHKIQQ